MNRFRSSPPVPSPGPARPLRVLVAEDDFLTASALSTILHDQGIRIVGPVDTLEAGMRLARAEEIDGAVLDIRLKDGADCFPIAEILAARTLPFIFISGYDQTVLPRAFAGRPHVSKPMDLAQLPRLIEANFRG